MRNQFKLILRRLGCLFQAFNALIERLQHGFSRAATNIDALQFLMTNKANELLEGFIIYALILMKWREKSGEDSFEFGHDRIVSMSEEGSQAGQVGYLSGTLTCC